MDKDSNSKIEEFTTVISKAEAAKLKAERDRKSDPDTIQRNVEICDLRKQDPKKWSHRMIGRKYALTPQAVAKILKEESKWRQLGAQAPTN